MRGVYYISALAILLFLKIEVHAQGVTLHADPRLSVLVRKPHNMEQATASMLPVKHRSPKPVRIEATVAVPAPVEKPVSNAKIITSSSTQPAKAEMPVKPYAGENGHAAGWTPPVRRKAWAVYAGKGFRVQIYNGPDRNKAITVKTEFMRMYPGIRTYLSYVSPSFRVKVGDYRNRGDAAGMLREANSMYNPSMIVPDSITISTF